MKKIALLLLVLCFPVFGAATLHIKLSTVTFEATGNPGFITIDGEGGHLESVELRSDGTHIWGTIRVPLNDLTTGMDLRDKHMRGYLDLKKYPYATLLISKTKIDGPRFSGLLTIKTDARPVGGMLNIKGKDVYSKFKINLAQFPSVGTPSWRGISIADEVTIEITARLSH